MIETIVLTETIQIDNIHIIYMELLYLLKRI